MKRGRGQIEDELTTADGSQSGTAEFASKMSTRIHPMDWLAASWIRELRHAARALRRAPGFTAMAVGTLGLAIGANAGIFSVVDAVLLRPLPYAHADRLVHIAASAPGSDMPREFGVAAEFFVQYQEQSKLLEDVSTYNSFTSTMRAGDHVERIRMSQPTSSMFSTLGVRPIRGRLPVADDEDRTVVISDALWAAWFNRDEQIVGRSYYVAGRDRTVIGVMGADFQFPVDGTLLWISTRIRPDGIRPGQFGQPLVARMAPGTTPQAVANELNELAKQLPGRFGGNAGYARLISLHRAVVRSLDEELLGNVKRPLFVLFAAVGIVLLIACINVANLFLVRTEMRQREVAVRRAVGATRAQLIRTQMAEPILVAALAGLTALAIVAAGLPAFLHAAPAGIPRLDAVQITGWTGLFTLTAAVLAALGCGLVASWRATTSSFARLADGSRSVTRGRRWGRDALVAGQTALALVLLIGAGLLVRSFWGLRHVDPGYDTANLFTFQIAPEASNLVDGPSFARFDLEFMDRLRALPGVQLVGLVENIPLNEGTAANRFHREGTTEEADSGPLLSYTFSAGDYFSAMGIDLVAGRTFATDDHLGPRRNIVISKSAAFLLWPGENAIGKRVRMQGMDGWDTVIGVVADVMQYNFRDKPNPLVYFPLVGPTPKSWAISSPAYVLKTPRAETIAADVRSLVRQAAPEAPMYRIYTMAGLAADSMVDVSFTMLTLGVAAALAVILGTVGLYGVLSYVVAQRTREIGVRMALGARTDQVARMVVGQGARVVVVGVALGALAAAWATQALSTLLFGVTALDAPTFTAMSIAMLAVGLAASYVPARRASRVDPIVSLKAD